MPFLGLATQGDTDQLNQMVKQVHRLTNSVRGSTERIHRMTEKSITDRLPDGNEILPMVKEGMTCFDDNLGGFALCIPSSRASDIPDDATLVEPKGKCIYDTKQDFGGCFITDDTFAFYNRINELFDVRKKECWQNLDNLDIGTSSTTIAEKCASLPPGDEYGAHCCTLLGGKMFLATSPDPGPD